LNNDEAGADSLWRENDGEEEEEDEVDVDVVNETFPSQLITLAAYVTPQKSKKEGFSFVSPLLPPHFYEQARSESLGKHAGPPVSPPG